MEIFYIVIFTLPWLVVFFQYRHYRKNKELFRQQINQVALPYFKSQMNPHFIKNVLQTLNYLILCDTRENANQCLKKFSVLVDKTLRHAEMGLISLSEEIELLEVYIELQHIRFPDKFDFTKEGSDGKPTIFVDPSIDPDEWFIPPMLVQPFVENAIVHGLEPKPDKGELHISFQKTGGFLECIIADNGIGRKASERMKGPDLLEKKPNGIGMKNVRNRISVLEQAFKINIGYRISDQDENMQTGTIVSLKVPSNLGKLEEFKVIEYENLILNK